MELLTRDQFREAVFARDNYKCVVCGEVAKDAHHIMERRLFPDGGYYIDNGASLCEFCHVDAERTRLTCEFIRDCAGIKKVVLPPHLYPDQRYDKWGNPFAPSGARMRGELFSDPSVQRILRDYLPDFLQYVKYPRTWHLPNSPGATKDDRVLRDFSQFEGEEVVVTVKMDGENTNLYRDYMHARSLDYSPHPSRARAKAIWARVAHEIPQGWRICAENVYAKHSIEYTELADYLLMFSIWNDQNICLSWRETRDWADLLDLKLVPWLFQGPWDEVVINDIIDVVTKEEGEEGIVVRKAGQFHYSEFSRSVAKYVRANHVQTHGHWMRQQIIPNRRRADGHSSS